jgi:hypothetical protein
MFAPTNNTHIMSFLNFISKFTDKKTACSIFGHKIVTVRNVTNHFKEYKCTVCNVELTNDLQDKKTFLTPQLKEINETLFQHHHRKHLSSL